MHDGFPIGTAGSLPSGDRDPLRARQAYLVPLADFQSQSSHTGSPQVCRSLHLLRGRSACRYNSQETCRLFLTTTVHWGVSVSARVSASASATLS